MIQNVFGRSCGVIQLTVVKLRKGLINIVEGPKVMHICASYMQSSKNVHFLFFSLVTLLGLDGLC